MTKRRTISQKSELIYDIHNFCINHDTRELFLHPHYDADNAEIDHRVANIFIKNINFLNQQNHNPILIHMCSCGGSYEYGLAIYDAIKSSPSIVYILVYAHATSMSSIILQAGDYRILSPNSYIMIHEGYDYWDGTNKGMITYASWAKYSTNQMFDIYIERCKNGPYFIEKGMNEQKIRTFLKRQIANKQEWYIHPQDAIQYGFIDYILEQKNCPDINNIISQV